LKADIDPSVTAHIAPPVMPTTASQTVSPVELEEWLENERLKENFDPEQSVKVHKQRGRRQIRKRKHDNWLSDTYDMRTDNTSLQPNVLSTISNSIQTQSKRRDTHDNDVVRNTNVDANTEANAITQFHSLLQAVSTEELLDEANTQMLSSLEKVTSTLPPLLQTLSGNMFVDFFAAINTTAARLLESNGRQLKWHKPADEQAIQDQGRFPMGNSRSSPSAFEFHCKTCQQTFNQKSNLEAHVASGRCKGPQGSAPVDPQLQPLVHLPL
jgi:hypothetical protein